MGADLGANDNHFIPIRVSTLRGDQQILFDVYVKVAGKHILYCRQGDSFEGPRLTRLKEKKIKQMFILDSSEALYRKYLTANIDAAYNKAGTKPIETRAQIIQGLQQASTEEILENPEAKEIYEKFKIDTKRYVDFLVSEDQGLRAILAIENSSGSIAHHGINVATLATALATKMGHNNDVGHLQLLATGCLLHDLEHQHTGLDVCRPLSELGPSEMALYQKHPTDGAARVQENSFYDQIVLRVISQHHENSNGTGFPKQLKESQIDPLVLIAGVCDAYDRMISFENISGLEALKKLLIDKVGLYPLELIQGLQQVLKERGAVK